MTNSSGFFLIAVLVGVAVALQGQFMGVMNRHVGTVTTMLITYGSGAIISMLLWIAARSPAADAKAVPWYAWSAGALGLIIVGGIGYAAPRFGLSRTLVITVAAQLAAAALIEHFGLAGSAVRPVDPTKVAGLCLTVAGVWLAVK
jgi:transporter family-2 protein